MRAGVGPANELDPLLDQGLSRLVGRMGLAGDDELHGPLRIGQQAQQPGGVVQEQVGPLVGREAPREAQCQGVGIEEMLRPLNRLGRRAGGSQLPGQPLAGVFDKTLGWRRSKFPKAGVGDAADVVLQVFHRPQPAVFSAGFRPKLVRRRRVPARHVDAVGDVSDRHFVRRPARKERLEEMAADFAMQTADAIDRAAAADGQIGHVESLRRVVRVLAAQGQQVLELDADSLLRVAAEVLLDEGRGETVETGGHRRVGGEKVPRPRGGQRGFEGLPGLLHETARALQHGEGRVAFVQVTDFRLDAQRAQAAASRQCRGASPARDATPARRRTARW